MSPEPQPQLPEFKERTIEGVCKTCTRPYVVMVGGLGKQSITNMLEKSGPSFRCAGWHKLAPSLAEGYEWNLSTKKDFTVQEIFELNGRGPNKPPTSSS